MIRRWVVLLAATGALVAPSASAECHGGTSIGGLSWVWTYYEGYCQVESRADASCYDEYGGPGIAYMDIQHEVYGNYGLHAADFQSNTGHYLQSCIDSPGWSLNCYNGWMRGYIADLDTGQVYMDDSFGLGSGCCGEWSPHPNP